jgi:hypothetical protein
MNLGFVPSLHVHYIVGSQYVTTACYRSQPLQNTSNTVVIVGGVHWLATQHLHTLLRVLRR